MSSLRSRILLGIAVLAGLVAVGAATAAGLFYLRILRDLPDLHTLGDYRPALASVVYDRNGKPIGEFFEERRRLVSLDDVPHHVIQSFVAGEDDSFFEHGGIDYRSIIRAAWVDLTSGELAQGASTITQQTVKTLMLTPERRFDRKIKEMILARRLEQQLTKQEILYLYLNQIYFGGGAYGIGEAARTYFGKRVGDLTLSEGALLAGLPKAPSRFSPRVNPEAAEERRQYVLTRMHELGMIDADAYAQALASPPELHDPPERADFEVSAWFTEEVRRLLFERLPSDEILRGGLQIETTLDLDLQRAADSSLRAGLEALDHRQGYQGPLRHVEAPALAAEVARVGAENALVDEADPDALSAADRLAAREPGKSFLGVVTALDTSQEQARVALAPGLEGSVPLADVKWAGPRTFKRWRPAREHIKQVFAVGDVARFRVVEPKSDEAEDKGGLRLSLFQEPAVEGAVLSLEVASGEVLALVGGYDFGRSQFDRAVQARRQPGSAFKPMIYTAAIEHGYTPVSTLYDRPVIYDDPSGFTWRPENYERHFLGPIPLHEALSRSVNNATIHLLKDVGVDRVVQTARRLGIRSPLEPNLSLALGSSGVSLLELTSAYATFPAGGRRVRPVFVRRVLDREGHVLLENAVLDAQPSGTDGDGEPRAAGTEARAPEPADEQLMDPADAYLMTDLLEGVIKDPHGTGRSAASLGRPLGGKTGTTNDQGDAWFIGFSPDVAAGVWVGFDEKQVLGGGETGARAALPVWIDYMRSVLANTPRHDFAVPEGISFARVDRETGKLADGSSGDAYFQAFRAGTEPTETSNDALSARDSRRLMRMDF
jgi:penicillin-binding protein 1A